MNGKADRKKGSHPREGDATQRSSIICLSYIDYSFFFKLGEPTLNEKKDQWSVTDDQFNHW